MDIHKTGRKTPNHIGSEYSTRSLKNKVIWQNAFELEIKFL